MEGGLTVLGAPAEWGVGLLRLKADFSSCWGEVVVGGARTGGGEIEDVESGGDENPKRSLESEDEGGLGFGCGGGDWKLEKPPKSCPFDETEVVRDCGFAGGNVGDVRLSNKPPPPPALPEEGVGDVTLGAAGADLLFAKLVNPANGEGFSVCFCWTGGDVGKLNPLKASVNPPILEEEVD
jgi:hypothetical protein